MWRLEELQEPKLFSEDDTLHSIQGKNEETFCFYATCQGGFFPDQFNVLISKCFPHEIKCKAGEDFTGGKNSKNSAWTVRLGVMSFYDKIAKKNMKFEPPIILTGHGLETLPIRSGFISESCFTKGGIRLDSCTFNLWHKGKPMTFQEALQKAAKSRNMFPNYRKFSS